MFGAAVFFVATALLLWWDYRSVKLEYLGDFVIDPPCAVDECGLLVIGGKDVYSYLNNALFLNQKEYSITWNNDIKIEDDSVYYVAIGKSINKITYFYHTKFINYTSNPLAYEGWDVDLNDHTNKRSIRIYKGDVCILQ